MNVPREAWQAEFIADIAASAAPGHRVADKGRPEIKQKILDEVAAAVAWIAPVAILTGTVEMVQAGEVRDTGLALRGASGSLA